MQYLELTCIVSPEDISWAMNSVMKIVHGIFSENNLSNIGVGFPEYSKTRLGSKVRLFGSDANIHMLQSNYGILRLKNRGIITMTLGKVPETMTYVSFKRKRPDSQSKYQQKKKFDAKVSYLKGKGINLSNEEKEDLRTRMSKKIPFYPFFNYTKERTGDNYPIYVDKIPSNDIPVTMGNYTSYGLSINGSCVPDF